MQHISRHIWEQSRSKSPLSQYLQEVVNIEKPDLRYLTYNSKFNVELESIKGLRFHICKHPEGATNKDNI